MPTLNIKLDCDKELSQQELDRLRDVIAEHDYSLVLFDSKYSEKTQIDWDQYMDQFKVLSA